MSSCIYSQHYCTRCRKYFNADMTDLAAPGQSLHPTRRRHRRPTGHRGRFTVSHRQLEPLARSPRVRPLRHDPELGRGRGEKAARRIPTDYLDWALSDFSGYIAADELYDGPFCILSIVDNRTFKRLAYQVLDHDPTHADIEAFFRRFQAALQARGLILKGITTDGSSLYPEPIATVFGDVPHQLCTFHVLNEVTKAVLSCRGQAPQGPGGRCPQAAAGPSRLEGGEASRPPQEADRAARSVSCSSTATCSSSTISRPPNGRPWRGSPAVSRSSAACVV